MEGWGFIPSLNFIASANFPCFTFAEASYFHLGLKTKKAQNHCTRYMLTPVILAKSSDYFHCCFCEPSHQSFQPLSDRQVMQHIMKQTHGKLNGKKWTGYRQETTLETKRHVRINGRDEKLAKKIKKWSNYIVRIYGTDREKSSVSAWGINARRVFQRTKQTSKTTVGILQQNKDNN